jgi:hypothetical protein
VGRVDLFLHYYFQKTQKLTVNIYQWDEEGEDLNKLVKVIEKNKIFEKTREQFQTDEEWNKYQSERERYLQFKRNAKDYKLDVYSYYDFENETFRGFKKLYYINKLGIVKKKIEGNCVILEGKVKYEHRKFTRIICWEGFKERTVSEELEMTQTILGLLTNITDLEIVPMLREEIKKKDLIIDQQDQTIKNIESDIYVANIKTPTGEKPHLQDIQAKWFLRLFILIVGMLGVFITIILLMVFGII